MTPPPVVRLRPAGWWSARSTKYRRRLVSECSSRFEAMGAATMLLDQDATDTIEVVDREGRVIYRITRQC